MKFSPTTDRMPSTPGIGRTMSSTCLTTISVRLIEAPSGRRSAAKMRALVLVRQKALRRLAEQQRRGRQHAGHDHDADDRDAHQAAHHRDVAVAHVVDRAQHVAHRAAARLAALEQHRAQRRAQRQRVERRDQHRHRDRHRELAEQLAADAGNEGHRDEHRQQHQRDGEDRAGDLRHRLLAGVRDRELGLLLDHPLDVLDHDDGVVDHDADGEHERQQRDGIGRVADRQHHRERADDRHRHRDQRDQRRAQLAEKQEHHQRHQDDGLDQRANDLVDGRGDEHRGVEEHVIGEVVGETRRQRVHGVAHVARHVDRIGARATDRCRSRPPARR